MDIQRKITDDVSTYVCPKCGEKMKQKIGNTIFRLKGTGWFKPNLSKGGESGGSKE